MVQSAREVTKNVSVVAPEPSTQSLVFKTPSLAGGIDEGHKTNTQTESYQSVQPTPCFEHTDGINISAVSNKATPPVNFSAVNLLSSSSTITQTLISPSKLKEFEVARASLEPFKHRHQPEKRKS